MEKWEYKFIDLKVKILSGTSQTEFALNELARMAGKLLDLAKHPV